MPKFGAGSEYGREAREEARRKKYGGGSRKKYNSDDQPWIIKISERGARKYRGVREEGVSENASYYIFTQAVDGAFEVFPVNHWYNFTPIQRYKSLTAEETEEQFGRRNKIYNYFSVMVRKRLKADDDGDADGEKLPGGKAAKKKASSGLKVSEMDDSDNEESDMKVIRKAMENLSDDDEDDDKSGDELDNAFEIAKLESGSSVNNSGISRDGTLDVGAVSGTKRKASSDLISGLTNASKKAKIELSPALVQSAASEGITEETVRRYLLRTVSVQTLNLGSEH